VEVGLKLNKDAPVHTDSKATIKFTGLMGQYYVAIDFGTPSAPHMEQNQLIATVEQPDLGALIAKLDDVATGVQNLTKSFTGDKIDNLLGPFTDFMRQNNPKLTAIIGNVQGISAQIADGKGTVGKLIYNDALYNSAYATVTNLQSVATEIQETASHARAVVDQINSGQGTVGKLVKEDKLYRETNATMKKLRRSRRRSIRAGSVGKVINDQFYKNAKLAAKLSTRPRGSRGPGPLGLLRRVVTTPLAFSPAPASNKPPSNTRLL
jgi:phospholipid/cholesterol/gamma-HCH transport system substrate-binding protein